MTYNEIRYLHRQVSQKLRREAWPKEVKEAAPQLHLLQIYNALRVKLAYRKTDPNSFQPREAFSQNEMDYGLVPVYRIEDVEGEL